MRLIDGIPVFGDPVDEGSVLRCVATKNQDNSKRLLVLRLEYAIKADRPERAQENAQGA
jgi:hypothetical protein